MSLYGSLLPHAKKEMRVLDLFSGIGGFSLGLERAGMRTVAFCEPDEYCRAVLRKHWPEAPIHDDVRTLPGIGCDLVCGGFPCQPWSQAGKQLGAQDDRHLWPAMLEVVKRERPAWVIGENVTGIINLGLDEVLSDLASEAYSVRPFVIPAVAVDAPHRRDRVWIVAHDNHRGRFQCPRDGEPQEGMGEQQGNDSAGLCVPLPDSGCEPAQVQTSGEFTTEQILERPCAWEVEPAVGRMADGVPSRLDRLRTLGNAVVPQIPEIIGRAIMRIEHGE